MDVIRYPYRSSMRLYKDRPDVLTPGRWYFCAPGAQVIPFYHSFISYLADWEEGGYFDPDIGEVPIRLGTCWGVGNPRLTGKHFCGTEQDWQEGALYAQRGSLPVDSEGIPLCCVGGPGDPGGACIEGDASFKSQFPAGGGEREAAGVPFPVRGGEREAGEGPAVVASGGGEREAGEGPAVVASGGGEREGGDGLPSVVVSGGELEAGGEQVGAVIGGGELEAGGEQDGIEAGGGEREAGDGPIGAGLCSSEGVPLALFADMVGTLGCAPDTQTVPLAFVIFEPAIGGPAWEGDCVVNGFPVHLTFGCVGAALKLAFRWHLGQEGQVASSVSFDPYLVTFPTFNFVPPTVCGGNFDITVRQ